MKKILGYLKSNARDLVNLWKKYGFSSILEIQCHTSVIVVYKNAKENGHRKSGDDDSFCIKSGKRKKILFLVKMKRRK